MSRIVLSNKELNNQTKLQYLVSKFGNKLQRQIDNWSYYIDGEYVEVLSEREEELRKYASHQFYKNHPFKALYKWEKEILKKCETKKESSKYNTNEISNLFNGHLNKDEKSIIKNTLWRKCKREGIDW